MYLVGETTHGHHQIEMACNTCHTSPFGGTEVLQDACVSCHGEELKAVSDSHPRSKFTDPRNADRVEILDARYCVTCHREHQEDITGAMGLTLPQDYCFNCHQDIAEERSTHVGLGFDTCASAGCHNYHDNLALYEDFLLKHAGEEDFLAINRRKALNSLQIYLDLNNPDMLEPSDVVVPDWIAVSTEISEWHSSSHQQAGVDCQSCHQPDEQSDGWVESPSMEVCASCHAPQMESFMLGKHGMRLKSGLPNMTPDMAKIAMKPDMSEALLHAELTCNSCHNPHDVNAMEAAVEACIGCHNSGHVNSYAASPHGQLYAQMHQGNLELKHAVTCATCHMPRVEVIEENHRVVRVNHNQNDNLRPNEKMIRSVCMDCHSLAFSIDSLADEALINNNFTGRPHHHIRSIDMAVERDSQIEVRDDSYQ